MIGTIHFRSQHRPMAGGAEAHMDPGKRRPPKPGIRQKQEPLLALRTM